MEELATKPSDPEKQLVSDTAETTRSTNMAQMYSTWVELGETIDAARAEMESLLANRRTAEAMRAEAQTVLEQAEAAWGEAGRLGDVARKAIERGFTVNLPGFAARLRMVDEIEQARMTQTLLRRSTNNEAWEEADRARQKATNELLKALTGIAAAASQAERELRETANLPAVAESLRDSAIEDLKCVRSIGDELAHLGQEAFSLLAISDVSVDSSRDEAPTPAPITGQLETQAVETGLAADATPDHQDTAAAADGTEAQDLQGTQTVPEITGTQPEVQEPSGVGAGNKTAGAVEAPQVGGETVESPPNSAVDELRRELEAAASLPGTGASGIQASAENTNNDSDAPGSSPEAAPSPISAAAELERELAALRPLLASTEPAALPAVAPTSSETAPVEVAGIDMQVRSSEAPSDTLLRRGQLNTNTGEQLEAVASAPEPEPSTPMPESYSGRVYLMFPASLNQDDLESVWESLEEVAGNGTISDHRLISRQDGIQFTLELGNKNLVVEQLQKRMPGAMLNALADDRLRIDLPSRGG